MRLNENLNAEMMKSNIITKNLNIMLTYLLYYQTTHVIKLIIHINSLALTHLNK